MASAPALSQTYSPSAAEEIGGSFLDSEIPFDVSRGRNVGVLERPRPDYEAIGIRDGSFLFYPQIKLGTGYSNNVYGDASGKVGDAFFTIDPNLLIQSDWSRNSISLDTGGALVRFANETIRNEDGYHATLNGNLQAGDATFTAMARIKREYEEQYSGGFIDNAIEPVGYTTKTGQLTSTYEGGQIKLIGSADVNRIAFSDSVTSTGAIIPEYTRNQTDVRGSGRIEYAATPDTSAFLQGTYTHLDYDSNDAIGGVANRSGHEVRALAGATFDLSALVRGSVGIGYVKRSYDSPVYRSLSGLTFDVRATYFMTQLTNITVSANRIIEDSVFPGSGGYFLTTYSARVDHELLRNLLLNVQGFYQRIQYDGIARHDRNYEAAGGANYFLNRNIGIGGTLSWAKRASDGFDSGANFNEFRAVGSVTFQI